MEKEKYDEPNPDAPYQRIYSPNVYEDYEWVRRNERHLRDKYGEIFVVVYRQKVIGTGSTYEDALKNADSNLPIEVEQVTPIVESLEKWQPFFQVHPKN